MNVRRHASIGFAVITGARPGECLRLHEHGGAAHERAGHQRERQHLSHSSGGADGQPDRRAASVRGRVEPALPVPAEAGARINSAFSNITLAPAAGGSGTGQSEALSGTIDMGGSDAYLSSSQVTANPGALNIPIAVSSQAVNYNLTGITNLKLSGSVIAQIYSGTITTWNDPAIAALNTGVTLPATPIVPIRRSDSSGDTFIFTSFLSATNSTWSSGPAFGTTVSWPTVSTELTASGNPAMVDTLHSTPGGIAYIGISVESTALVDGLGEAELENASGSFVQPNATTVDAAVTAGSGNVPASLAASLIYETGAQSYPIVNFEYLIINPSKITSSDTALAVRTFIEWAISSTGGATADNLSAVNFEPLPTSVIPLVNTAVAQITG